MIAPTNTTASRGAEPMPQQLPAPVLTGCGEHLSEVDGSLLDCVSDALALLLAHHGFAEPTAPFSCDWRFDLVDTDGALDHGLDLPPRDQDDLLAMRTGWRPRWRAIGSPHADVAAWSDILAGGSPVVLVGDAFGLPWLPYRGHEHMEHGFVLEGIEPSGPDGDAVLHVVDPYENATQWGRAVPVRTTVQAASVLPALDGGRWAVLEPSGEGGAARPLEEVLAANARAILDAAEGGSYRRFAEQYRPLGVAELHHLALQTWLLTRNRGLHRRWLESVATTALAERFAADVEVTWQRTSEMAYLALRRVRSGRAAPTGVLAALETAAEAERVFASAVLTGKGGSAC